MRRCGGGASGWKGEEVTRQLMMEVTSTPYIRRMEEHRGSWNEVKLVTLWKVPDPVVMEGL